MKPSCLVILSGGQDSTTCLFWAMQHYEKVHAITFDYGQRHKRELEAAEKVFDLASVQSHQQVVSHEYIVVGNVLRGTSPLVSRSELEQYKDMHSLPGGLEKTFVPGRNLLFLTLAANYAYSLGCTTVVIGVCEEDFGGYPDCRQVFIDSAQDTIREGLGYIAEDGTRDAFCDFCIETPLMHLTKAQTVRMAAELPGCWDALAYTHTAYDGAYPPTGQDHATLLRAKGFLEAGMPDPLVMRAWQEGLMELPNTPNYLF